MKIEEIFAAEGPVSQTHNAFEARTGQVAMARAVESAFANKRHLVVQAGTGLGKTFAYLVPAIMFALKEHKRVIISTKTITLQEQIFKKDIPFLQQAIGNKFPFVAVLAKGRGNFICRRKMDYLRELDRGLLTSREQVEELRQLQELVSSNRLMIGDREEIPFSPRNDLWQHVCGEGEACLRRACPYFETCYYYSSRRAQIRADIVVVNHALFFADLAIRKEAGTENEQGVLEDYDAVIFDEAHNIEDVATDFFSRRVGLARVKVTGAAISASFKKGGALHQPDASEAIQFVEGLIHKVGLEAGFFFSQFTQSKRLYEVDKYENVLKGPLSQLAKELTTLQGGSNTEEQNAYLTLLYDRVLRIVDDLTFILERRGGEEEHAYWVESGDDEATLVSAPIAMEEDIREHVFRKIDTVVLTSATLSSVLLRRIGLEKCDLLRLDSPFDYENNTLLFLPRDAVNPKESSFDEYTAIKIREIVKVTEGRALVLFTSYRSMNTVYDRLLDLSLEGFTLLKQGSGSRSEVMQRFKTGRKAVLLAVASYWEGIDVPGEALSCVILVKLPFSVPTEPIMEARFEHIKRQGDDAFQSYSLPQAVLRLKQGFGRLIRTASDKGVVAILDHRVQNRQYGKAFLKELPPAKITHSLEEVRKLLGT